MGGSSPTYMGYEDGYTDEAAAALVSWADRVVKRTAVVVGVGAIIWLVRFLKRGTTTVRIVNIPK